MYQREIETNARRAEERNRNLKAAARERLANNAKRRKSAKKEA